MRLYSINAGGGLRRVGRDVALQLLNAGEIVCVGPDAIGDRTPSHDDVITIAKIVDGSFDIMDPEANVLANGSKHFPGEALDLAASFLVPIMLWLDQEIERVEVEGQSEALEVLRAVKAHLTYEALRDGAMGQYQDYRERRALDPN